MADTKTTGLASLAAWADGDIFACVDDPGGTPLNRKVTIDKVATYTGGKNLSNLADAGTSRTNLGVAIGSDVQAFDADLATLASAFKTASSTTAASLALAEDTDNGSNTVTLIAPATVTSNRTITLQDVTGTVIVTGGTDVAVADGGTGASNAGDARTNLGLVIGTDVQAQDAGLSDIAALAVTDSNIIVGNGSNWIVESGATARTSLGLTIGTDVQAFDADLTTLASAFKTASSTTAASLAFAEDTDNGSNTVTIISPVSVSSDKIQTLQDIAGTILVTGGSDVAVADGGTGASDAGTARTNLGVAIGSDVQAFDAGLADVAGLAVTDGNFIVGDGANWVAESGATARTSLGVPGSTTDHTLIRANGTAGVTQGSNIVVSDDDEISQFHGLMGVESSTAITLVAADTGTIITTSSTKAATIITLPNSLVQGFNCSVIQNSTAAVSFAAASGATLNNRQSHTKIAGRYGVSTVIVVSTSGGSTAAVYVLAGDTST